MLKVLGLSEAELYGMAEKEWLKFFGKEREVYQYDFLKKTIGDEMPERPRTVMKSSFPNKSPEYTLDLGRAFLAPWPGRIFLEGGTIVDSSGTPVPNGTSVQDVEMTIQRPELKGSISSVADAMRRIFLHHRLMMYGNRPMSAPTMTYYGKDTTQIPVPNGAVGVQGNATLDITWQINGLPITGARISSDVGGQPLPIAYIAGAGGTFASTGPSSIPVVSFTLEIA